MNDRMKSSLVRAGVLAIVSLVFVGGLVSAWPSYERGRSLKIQDARLAAEIEAKRREIAELKEYQHRFRTDSSFVEQIARQNRRVFPGELVFIFEDRQ